MFYVQFCTSTEDRTGKLKVLKVLNSNDLNS